MTKPSFPANPSDKAPYTSGGVTYTWNDTLGVWSAEPSGGGGLQEPVTFKQMTISGIKLEAGV